MRGPVDFIIVGFEGNKFDGSILKALGDAIDQGVIGLITVALMTKDPKGVTTLMSIDSVDGTYVSDFAKKYPGDPDLVDKDDIDEMSDLLENNTAAGLLIIEHLWAIPLKEAITKANGVLVSEGRIHPDAASELAKK